MTFVGNNTEIWFRIFGDSLKFNYRASGTSPILVSVDGGAFTAPPGGTFINTSTTVLSGEVLPGGTSDNTHDIRIRLSTGYSNGGFRLRTADAIVVTSTGGVAAVSAHPDFGQVQEVRGAYGLLNFHDTYQGDLIGSVAFGYTSPIFPGVTPTMTTRGRNSYVEFYVNSSTTKLYVFAVNNNTTADAIFSMWVNDVRYAPTTVDGSTLGLYGCSGPYTVPGTGTRKIRLTNLRGCYAVVVNGAFVDRVFSPGVKVAFSGDSVTSADSVTTAFDASGNWDQLIDILYKGRIEVLNRGVSGDTAAAWNAIASGAGRIADFPTDIDLLIANMSVNDATAAASNPSATQTHYETYYSKLLARCPDATILAVPQLPYSSVNRTAIVNVIQAAVAAINDPRLIYVTSDNMVVTEREGSHPKDLGKAQACGGGVASINISAQPADGDTITINTTTFEFDSNASVGSANISVTIGATLVDTINNLGAAIAAQSGAAYKLLEYIIVAGDTGKQGVAIYGCTSLSKVGTNITVHGPEAYGWLPAISSYIDDLLPQSSVIIQKAVTATNGALWRFNETSGNFRDSLNNSHTLIARGTPTYSQTAPEATAVLFDGTNDEAATALVTPLGSTLPDAFTIGFNVKGLPQAGKALMAFSNGGSQGALAFLTGANAGVDDGRLRMQVQTATNGNIILSLVGPTILDGAWHHVVAVGTGGNSVKVFIDGVAQTPLSGNWAISRPNLIASAVAGIVLNDSFPQNPSVESAITTYNAFAINIALSDQDVIDIYNSGVVDTIAPVLNSATISANGTSVVLSFTEIGSPPLLPSTGVTGFTLSRLGVNIPLSSATRTGNTEITLTPSSAIPPGPVLLNYSGGNVTDSLSNDLATITDFAVTNDSTISTYAKITMLGSVSTRMAPHTVWVTACEESTPINGAWRYTSALWNFGDGSSVLVTNPVTGEEVNSTRSQTSWACASHTYESTGDYTITLTLVGQDGVIATDSTTVSIAADTRTTKYWDSSANPGGDGSQSSPWSTHDEMVAGLTSNTTVLMSGSFDLALTSSLPVVSNVWFKPASANVTFHWTTNPATDSWVFRVPLGAENILIDGKNGDHTSRGIIITSDVGKSITKSDNQTGFMATYGNSVKCRNIRIVGDYTSGGVVQGAVFGGNSSQVTSGLSAENCDFGDCNNYLSVYTRMAYVSWVGVIAGTAWVEHTQRWLDPVSKYIGHQWSEFDHKRILNGVVSSSGQASKDCIRFQCVEYATVTDCILKRGVIDFSYNIGDATIVGGYGPGHHILYNRCVIDDCGIYIRPNAIDAAIANCYIKDTPF